MSQNPPQPHTNTENTYVHLDLPDAIDPVRLLGPADQVLRIVEREFPGLQIHVRERSLALSGPVGAVKVAADLFEELISLAQQGEYLDAIGVEHALRLLREADSPAENRDVLSTGRKTIRAKTAGQQAYVEALADYPIVFGIGPAGTGKTYLAMARAVSQLLAGRVRRIVLTRPAVEAGENLGFLPGTLNEKIAPYLRPLYDALRDMMAEEDLAGLMDSGAVEVAPLAYMRGRTLNDSYVILDEAQNTTPAQMKMFLTRLGFGSQMVVTGDVSQIDLGAGQVSGLTQVQRILADIGSIKFCYLTSEDVVRHSLVTEIVDAYERWDATQLNRRNSASAGRKRA